MEEQKKCACGMPLDDYTKCKCMPDTCYHCCTCPETCECGCMEKRKKDSEKTEEKPE